MSRVIKSTCIFSSFDGVEDLGCVARTCPPKNKADKEQFIFVRLLRETGGVIGVAAAVRPIIPQGTSI